MNKDNSVPQQQQLLVIATRIHVGESSSSKSIAVTQVEQQIEQFVNFCVHCGTDLNHSTIPTATNDNNNNNNNHIAVIVRGVIAVDATPNNDLLNIVRMAIQKAKKNQAVTSTTTTSTEVPPDEQRILVPVDVIPVQPWGKFTPALNALLSYAANSLRTLVDSVVVTNNNNTSSIVSTGGSLLYCSLEMTNPSTSNSGAVRTLLHHYMDYDTTLVCGAVLPGHDHHHCNNNDNTNITTSTTTTENNSTPKTTTETTVVVLTGRTTPWNTFAIWNIQKLSKLGFVSVAEGLHVDITTSTDSSTNLSENTTVATPSATTTTKNKRSSIAGIEEVATIALLQRLYNPHTEMMAKLVRIVPPKNHDLDGDAVATLTWDIHQTMDVGRQQWHEYKMQSKLERAQQQLQLLSLLPPSHNHTNYENNATTTNASLITEAITASSVTSSSVPGIVYHY